MNFKLNVRNIIILIVVLIAIAILLILILFSYNYIFNKKYQEAASLLCKDTYSECEATNIIPCNYKNSTIYRVNYGCMDLPPKYFDSNLKLINDSCGGMMAEGETTTQQTCNELDKGCYQEKSICCKGNKHINCK